MSQPIYPFIAGASRFIPAYVPAVNDNPPGKVTNPSSSECYEPMLTTVIFNNYPRGVESVSIKTEEKYDGPIGREEACFEETLYPFPGNRAFQFTHTCDFSLNIQVNNEIESVSPLAGQVNVFSLAVLFPQGARPARPQSSCCVVS